jgi:hypothetical protein
VRKVVDLIFSSRVVGSKLTIVSISLGTHSTGMKGVSTAMPPVVLRLRICLSADVAWETYLHHYLPEYSPG